MPLTAVRDRDYLLDRHGVIFKVIGDVHPDSHYLGYVTYHPDGKGDRRLFGQTYRQNSVVSKSFGILADRPECYVYSPVLGCVITGLPRQDIAAQELFKVTDLIRPYTGDDLTRLYLRRAKYMAGSDFDSLIKQEQRKLQGLTPHADAHINCEPIRSDNDRTFARMYAKET